MGCNMVNNTKCICSLLPCMMAYYHARAVETATDRGCCCACCLDFIGCACLNVGIIREKCNIDGNMCTDFLKACLCPCCTILRDINEVDMREDDKQKGLNPYGQNPNK